MGSRMRKYNLFQETEDYEHGFREYYAEEIYPIQKELEDDRKKHLVRFLLKLSLFVLVAMMLSMLVLLTAFAIDVIIFSAAVVLGMYIFTFWHVFHYKKLVKVEVFQKTVDFFKGFKYLSTGDMCPLDYQDSKILPDYLSYTSEDKLMGTHGGVQVKLAEVRLLKPRLIKYVLKLILLLYIGAVYLYYGIINMMIILAKGGYDLEYKYLQMLKSFYADFDEFMCKKETFNGLFIEFEMPKKFHGTTIGLKDGGKLGNYIKSYSVGRLKNVSLESGEFEDLFEVYSNSQIESRCILEPAFMSRLLDLSKEINNRGRKGMSFSFFQNKCFMMIPCDRNMFEPRSIFKSCISTKDVKKFLKETSIIFDVIDILNLNMEKNIQRLKKHD